MGTIDYGEKKGDDNNPITTAGLEVHFSTALGIVAEGAALLFNSLFWFAYSDRKASLFFSLAISSIFIIRDAVVILDRIHPTPLGVGRINWTFF